MTQLTTQHHARNNVVTAYALYSMKTLHMIYDVMICLNLLSPRTHSIVNTFICNLFALRAIQMNREASTPKNDNLAVCIWLVCMYDIHMTSVIRSES
jgi:hypothetical protein